MIRTFIAALAISFGSPVFAESVQQDHEYLWNAIRDVGINVVINHPSDCNGQYAGVYDSLRGYITICQDNAKIPFSIVEWTANDYDTLRHEAQHIIQDCHDNRLGDGELTPMFADQSTRYEFIADSLTNEEIEYVIKQYENSSTDTIQIELEAFAVAKNVNARSIADKVTQWCANL